MDFLVSALRQNPELAIFLTVAVGFFIGRFKFGSFSLGIVVGCLLAGVLIGQLEIKVPSIVKTVFFDLFSVHHWVQGGTAILSWTEEGRSTPGRRHLGAVCGVPAHRVRHVEAPRV